MRLVLLASALLLGLLPEPSAAAPLRDPCAGRAGKWTALSLTPADSIGAAMACAAPGFRLTLADGWYKQVFDVPAGLDGWDIGGGSAARVKLDGQGGCTVPNNNAGSCPTRLAWGKGVVHLSSAGTLHDLEVTGGGTNAEGEHDGQAGVYIDGGVNGTVTLRRLMLRRNENGAFSNGTVANADIVVEQCDFVDNSTDGGSHSAYWSGGRSLTLTDVHDYGSLHGNNQKSRIPIVKVSGGFNQSREGRWVECADGCRLTITGGTYVGNTCCRNVFGNGTESTSKGPGDTSWTGSTIWIGRASNFANAGRFEGKNLKLLEGSVSATVYNDKGGELTGLDLSHAKPAEAPPAPPFVSGAN